jgi:molybdopterin-binding protein
MENAAGRDDDQCGAVRAGDGEVLGDELGDDHLEERRDQQRQGERDPRHGVRGHTGGLQAGAYQAGERRFGQEADEQGRHGDAELRAGQLRRQGPQPGQHAGGPAFARLGALLDRSALDRDEAELGGDEQAAGQREQHRDPEQDPLHQRTPPPLRGQLLEGTGVGPGLAREVMVVPSMTDTGAVARIGADHLGGATLGTWCQQAAPGPHLRTYSGPCAAPEDQRGRRAPRRERRHGPPVGRAGAAPAVPSSGGPRLVEGSDVARLAEETGRAPQVGAVAGASARNRFRGVVTRVTRDTVMAQVEVQAGPFRVVSLLSREAVDELGLEPGSVVVATAKATSVGLEVPAR